MHSKLKPFHVASVDAAVYDWSRSKEGQKYWEDYVKKTSGMNAFQYIMHIDNINNVKECKNGKER